jgi:hypothetical protein
MKKQWHTEAAPPGVSSALSAGAGAAGGAGTCAVLINMDGKGKACTLGVASSDLMSALSLDSTKPFHLSCCSADSAMMLI